MKKVLLAACAMALTVGGLTTVGISPATADPATAGNAAGYGTLASLAATPLIDRAGLAQATLPPGGDDAASLLLVPVAPVLINGTANGTANAHQAADIPTALEVATQTVNGPYNLRGIGGTDSLDVLAGIPNPVPNLPDIGVSIVSADAVRAEAVGVCRGGAPAYSANSEVVNLKIGGTVVPLNGPITDLVDALNVLLQPLSQVADIARNEVVTNAGGTAVNALHVTILGGIGVPASTPVLDLIVGHAQVGGLNCQPATAQCADNVDNDGDGVIDRNDPGCINNGVYDPNDNDERNECIDTVDNDGDGQIDFGADPGCSSPQDDDETDPLPQTQGTGGELARTGGESKAPLAGGLALFAIAAFALRRRSVAGR